MDACSKSVLRKYKITETWSDCPTGSHLSLNAARQACCVLEDVYHWAIVVPQAVLLTKFRPPSDVLEFKAANIREIPGLPLWNERVAGLRMQLAEATQSRMPDLCRIAARVACALCNNQVWLNRIEDSACVHDACLWCCVFVMQGRVSLLRFLTLLAHLQDGCGRNTELSFCGISRLWIISFHLSSVCLFDACNFSSWHRARVASLH